eukprot:6179838-Pleurochrysis_carterae.AAC.3
MLEGDMCTRCEGSRFCLVQEVGRKQRCSCGSAHRLCYGLETVNLEAGNALLDPIMLSMTLTTICGRASPIVDFAASRTINEKNIGRSRQMAAIFVLVYRRCTHFGSERKVNVECERNISSSFYREPSQHGSG